METCPGLGVQSLQLPEHRSGLCLSAVLSANGGVSTGRHSRQGGLRGQEDVLEDTAPELSSEGQVGERGLQAQRTAAGPAVRGHSVSQCVIEFLLCLSPRLGTREEDWVRVHARQHPLGDQPREDREGPGEGRRGMELVEKGER